MRWRSFDRLADGLARLSVFIFFYIGLTSTTHAQIGHTLSVDVTQEGGIYNYTYTLTNSPLSSQPINVVFFDVAKGPDVVRGELVDANENGFIDAFDAEVSIFSLDSPDGWVGEYEPYALEIDEVTKKPTGVKESNGVPELQSIGQVAYLSTIDGETCSNPADDIHPGQTLEFTIQSEYAPVEGEGSYFILSVDANCEDVIGFGEGDILTPWQPPQQETPACDLDGDGDCDLADIDRLHDAIVGGSQDDRFDLNNDMAIDQGDITAFLLSSEVNRINGDLDFNGIVDFDDFLALSGNFGVSQKKWSEGDILVNGDVDFDDFLQLSANFGLDSSGGAAAASVPEPSGWQLGNIAMLLLLYRMRSRRNSSGVAT